MTNNKLRLGLPKGSLNTERRGNTNRLLVFAGFEPTGYEPGEESEQSLTLNDKKIKPFLVRPQTAPIELSIGFLDAAIIGDDWVEEETAANRNLGIVKIGSLDYGRTRIVLAASQDLPYTSLTEFFYQQFSKKNPLVCFTEYPNMTRRLFMLNPSYQQAFGKSKPVVQVRGLKDGDNSLVYIINSDGLTEGFIQKGADLVVDNTQSGKTLGIYRLRELEQVFESSAGLYVSPSCRGWKRSKAESLYERLRLAQQQTI